MNEQLIEGLFVVAAITLIFGVWEIVKTLRVIQSDLRLMRVMKYGTKKPEGWEE